MTQRTANPRDGMNPTVLGDRFYEAIGEARCLHRAQEHRGSGVPYMTRLFGAAAVVLHFEGDEDQAIAGHPPRCSRSSVPCVSVRCVE